MEFCFLWALVTGLPSLWGGRVAGLNKTKCLTHTELGSSSMIHVLCAFRSLLLWRFVFHTTPASPDLCTVSATNWAPCFDGQILLLWKAFCFWVFFHQITITISSLIMLNHTNNKKPSKLKKWLLKVWLVTGFSMISTSFTTFCLWR